VVWLGRRKADGVDLDILDGFSDIQLADLLLVAQPERIAVEMVDENAFQLEILVEHDDAVVPAVDDQHSSARVQTHVREVVQVVHSVIDLDVVAGDVELADHEYLGGVLSSPVAHDDRSVTSRHGEIPR